LTAPISGKAILFNNHPTPNTSHTVHASQVLVHPPSWSTADYVTASLERLAAAVISNDAAAVAADDGSTIAYAVLWKHYLEQTEADEVQQHHRLQANSKGNLQAATAGGGSLIFGPYPALVVAGGSMMRIRGIKHNGELKLLINTPHTLVLREKVSGCARCCCNIHMLCSPMLQSSCSVDHP
jgi:hypothetical protein